MPTNTTTYSFQKPVVGADEDSWGGYLNSNWDKVDDLFDGTSAITGIDINSGTIDGTVIGGSSAAAGTFTTLTASTSITGTLATAAQPNITSVGSLTSLDVAGTLTSDGLTVDASGIHFKSDDNVQSTDIVRISSNNNAVALSFGYDTIRGAAINLNTNSSNRINIANNGDISFYDAAGVSQSLFWDASAESLGIGTSSPSALINTSGAVGAINSIQTQMLLSETGTNTGTGLQIKANNSTYSWDAGAITFLREGAANSYALVFDTSSGGSNAERMRIDSSGNVGIGIVPSATGGGFKALQLGLMTNWAFPTTGSAYRSHNLYYDGTNRKYVTTGTAHEYEQSSAGHVFSTAASGTAGTNVTLSEAMRIDSSGRVGIGTDSPSSYDFNDPAKLVVANTSGNSTLSIASGSSSIGYLAFADGTSGTSRYAGSILYNHSTNYMSMQTTDGTERMRIDSSGSLTLDPNANGAHYLVLNTSTSGDGHIILQRNTSNKYQIAAGTSNELQFYNYTAGSESMRIDSSGRVGIGTTSPQGKFNVSDSGGYGFEFFPNDASLNHLLSYDRTASVYRDFKLSGSQIIFGYGQSGSNEAMRINSSGNVGIGIDSPSSRLDIRNTGGTYDKGISIQTNSGGNIGTIWTTNTDLNLGIAGAHIFTNYDGSSERMRIDSSGRVMIGTTTEGQVQAENLTIADSGNMGMTLRSTTSAETSIFFSDGTSGTAEYAGWLQYAHATDVMTFGVSATERMRIDSSGNVRIAQTSADWGSLSVEQDFDAKSDISVTAGNYAYIDLPAYQHAGLIIVKVLNDGNSNANLSKLYLYNSRATAFGGGNSVTEVAGTQGSTGTSAEPVISAVAITNTVSGDNPRLRLSVTTVGGTGTLSVYARCINV